MLAAGDEPSVLEETAEEDAMAVDELSPLEETPPELTVLDCTSPVELTVFEVSGEELLSTVDDAAVELATAKELDDAGDEAAPLDESVLKEAALDDAALDKAVVDEAAPEELAELDPGDDDRSSALEEPPVLELIADELRATVLEIADEEAAASVLLLLPPLLGMEMAAIGVY